MDGVMARSPESTAREEIRHRSTPKRNGRRSSDGGEGGFGHPLIWDATPAFDLEAMPEGGGYPVGFVELAAKLMGCQDLGAVVHLCSGSVRGRRCFDYRAESAASCLADVRRLPIATSSVEWVMADPPYGPDYAEDLWKLGKQYPMPAVIMRECARILRPGGAVAFLHHVVPDLPPQLVRAGTWGITNGPGYRIRALTVARRSGEEALPW
jgi:hypothetical protein